ncbi:microfibril-associated glycoprotein 4-like [Mantella aurantiaca]
MQPLSLDLALFLLFCSVPVMTVTLPLNQNQFNTGQPNYGSSPFDCKDVYDGGMTSDGVYLIYPRGLYSVPVPVFCDMTSPKGPWTVFQKRFDGSENFFRGWEDYKAGFGRADSEYWLGLENIYLLTLRRSYRLRIDLSDFDNDARFVIYNKFALSPAAISAEEDNYKLYIDGFQEGDPSRPAGNSLWDLRDMAFSTHDHDRDKHPGNCASMFKAGSWYNHCHSTNLNGLYLGGANEQYAVGMTWSSWRGQSYSLKTSQMKIAANV